MKLSEKDADLFYDLMWPLQFFVNQKLQVNKNIKTLEDYINSNNNEEKRPVRKSLYDNIKLIDDFIKENPQQFSDDKLQIIRSWKSFIAGEFHIERFLKRYTILISSTDKVYAVLGLYQSFEELFFSRPLPIFVRTYLLPFKGNIIYDGFIETYNIFFGGNISRRMKEVYMTAKQNGKIIETLEPKEDKIEIKCIKKPEKDWNLELCELLDKAKAVKVSSDQHPIISPVFSLIKSSIEFGQLAASNPSDLYELWEGTKKVKRALKKIETTLYRSE
ncbi:MAG: hypothetical protein HQK79_22045 [Desulfobacterales bacterium]|nr:hypothetical protein [Desulfobacterales bacterium]